MRRFCQYDLGGRRIFRCVRRLAFIVDLVNVFSLLRVDNGCSAMALDTGIVRHQCINFVCVMDGANGVDGA